MRHMLALARRRLPQWQLVLRNFNRPSARSLIRYDVPAQVIQLTKAQFKVLLELLRPLRLLLYTSLPSISVPMSRDDPSLIRDLRRTRWLTTGT